MYHLQIYVHLWTLFERKTFVWTPFERTPFERTPFVRTPLAWSTFVFLLKVVKDFPHYRVSLPSHRHIISFLRKDSYRITQVGEVFRAFGPLLNSWWRRLGISPLRIALQMGLWWWKAFSTHRRHTFSKFVSPPQQSAKEIGT